MNFPIFMLNRFQLAALDIIWLELNAELELDLYIINYGDQVFIPGLTFPKHPNRLSPYPTKLRLKKNLVYIPIELTKQSNVKSSSSCNRTSGYTYGRKYLAWNICRLNEKICLFFGIFFCFFTKLLHAFQIASRLNCELF